MKNRSKPSHNNNFALRKNHQKSILAFLVFFTANFRWGPSEKWWFYTQNHHFSEGPQRKLAVKNVRNAKIDVWWFLCIAKLFLWLRLERVFIMFIFWMGKNYHKTTHTVHIFVRNLIWKLSTALRNHEFSILLPTSEGCRSAPRWNWMTSKYTRAMYSSRYVDFWGLKLKPINLTVRNPVVKFVEFGENPESGLAPP